MTFTDMHGHHRSAAQMRTSDQSGEPRTVGMNVSLPVELASAVRSMVQDGLYASASEVIREALRRFLASPIPERGDAIAKRQHDSLDVLMERIAAMPAVPESDRDVSGSSNHDSLLYGPDAS